jgi:hypothetical protein
MDIVPDELAFAKGIQMICPDGALMHQSQILPLEGGAGLQATLPAPNTVSSLIIVSNVFLQFLETLASV